MDCYFIEGSTLTTKICLDSEIHLNLPRIAIDGHAYTLSDALHSAGNVDHGGDAVFAGDDGAMRDEAAGFGHQSGGAQKERCPGRIGGRRHEHIAGGEAFRMAWVGDEASWSGRNASRHTKSGKSMIAAPRGGRASTNGTASTIPVVVGDIADTVPATSVRRAE